MHLLEGVKSNLMVLKEKHASEMPFRALPQQQQAALHLFLVSGFKKKKKLRNTNGLEALEVSDEEAKKRKNNTRN